MHTDIEGISNNPSYQTYTSARRQTLPLRILIQPAVCGITMQFFDYISFYL